MYAVAKPRENRALTFALTIDKFSFPQDRKTMLGPQIPRLHTYHNRKADLTFAVCVAAWAATDPVATSALPINSKMTVKSRVEIC